MAARDAEGGRHAHGAADALAANRDALTQLFVQPFGELLSSFEGHGIAEDDDELVTT